MVFDAGLRNGRSVTNLGIGREKPPSCKISITRNKRSVIVEHFINRSWAKAYKSVLPRELSKSFGMPIDYFEPRRKAFRN